MSPLMKQFLVEWNNWRLNGAKKDPIFNQIDGLCHASYLFGQANQQSMGSTLEVELSDMFEEEFGGSRKYNPFGYENYCVHMDDHTQHLMPERIEWVLKHIS